MDTDVSKLVAGYRQLRDKKGQLESALKEKVAPVNEMMAKIEARLLQIAIEQTDVSALVGSYRQLRDNKGQMEAAVKASVKPLSESMERIEAALLQISIDQKVTSFKTPDGTAYKYPASSVRVTDRSRFIEYVTANEAWELLPSGTSKNEVIAAAAARAQELKDALDAVGGPNTAAGQQVLAQLGPPEIPGIEIVREDCMGFRAPTK